MSGPSIITEQLASSRAQNGSFWRPTLSDYWMLTKPEVNFLILITTGVGFYLGCGHEARPLSVISLFNTWNIIGGKWNGHAESIHRTEVRRADAPDSPAPCRSRSSQNACSFSLWDCIGWDW